MHTRHRHTICLCVLTAALCVTSAFASFHSLSKDEWSKILVEMQLPADTALLSRMERANGSIEKIQTQTKGNLRLDNWIEIFRKLDIAPKKDMKTAEWAALFTKVGVSYPNDNATAATTSTTNPAPTTSTTTVKQAPAEPTVTAAPAQPVVATEATQPKQPAASVETAKVKTARVTLDLRGADVFTALKIISQKTGISIVASGSVKGSVTLYVQDMDAMDAFKMILEMNDLAYVQDGTVYKVMSNTEYERVYGRKFYDATTVDIVTLTNSKAITIEKLITPIKSKVGQIISDPISNVLILIDTPDSIAQMKKMIAAFDIKLETKAFSLNYSKPKDILDKVKSQITPTVGDVQADERSNQLIITDSPSRMADLTTLIKSLDKRNQEVIIEAKIVQIILGDALKYGVNWEQVFNQVNLGPGANFNYAGHLTANLSGQSDGAAAIRMNVGTLSIDNFNAVFDVLQTVGKTNMVSSPKIATIENQEAKILVGTKEAYVTTTVSTPGTGVSTTAESVTFIDVGIKLFVTPTVGDDGFITMKIRPEVSSVDRLLQTSQGNSIPIVRTSESETTVMVKDGITIVIGGLIEERDEKSTSGIPLLCKIPFIGPLFGKTSIEKTRTELAVFLTPRVMTGDVTNVTPFDQKTYKPK